MKIFRCPSEECKFVILREHHSNSELWEHTRGYAAQVPGGICDKCGLVYNLEEQFCQNMILNVDPSVCKVDFDMGIIVGKKAPEPDVEDLIDMAMADSGEDTVVVPKPKKSPPKPKAKPKKKNKGGKKTTEYESKLDPLDSPDSLVEEAESEADEDTESGDDD